MAGSSRALLEGLCQLRPLHSLYSLNNCHGGGEEEGVEEAALLLDVMKLMVVDVARDG